MPKPIRSLIKCYYPNCIKSLNFSFELISNIEKKYNLIKIFESNYFILKKLILAFGSNHTLSYLQSFLNILMEFHTLNDIKILIIFKRNKKLELEGLIYARKYHKMNRETEEILNSLIYILEGKKRGLI